MPSVPTRIATAVFRRSRTASSLETNAEQSSPGHLVELHQSPLDWRDYLDDQPIHNGDQLELWTGSGWHPVRYETVGQTQLIGMLNAMCSHIHPDNYNEIVYTIKNVVIIGWLV